MVAVKIFEDLDEIKDGIMDALLRTTDHIHIVDPDGRYEIINRIFGRTGRITYVSDPVNDPDIDTQGITVPDSFVWFAPDYPDLHAEKYNIWYIDSEGGEL